MKDPKCDPPQKPHFFTFVSPHTHSQNGSLIPISFMQKYLNGEKSENALLKRGCRKWHVKIEGRRFAKGWDKFQKENRLELGDFIVFRHEGDFVFHVMVFDPTSCEKQYPLPSTTTMDADEAKTTVTPKPQAKSLKEIPANIQATSKDVKKKKKVMRPHSNAKAKSARNHPSFSATLTQNGIKKSVLYVPYVFAKLNGLSNRQCEMVIRDERLRSWTVKLRNEKRNQYRRASVIRGGWGKFCVGNDLKEGDEFMLELVETGEKPVMNFYLKSKDVEKEKKVTVNPTAKSFSSKCDNHRSFSTTLTRSGIANSFLHVPNKFVRLNGLRNVQCEMIIRDERRRPWSVQLNYKKSNITSEESYFGRGWRIFCIGNGLKEGDEVVLELVKKGEKPVMNFCLRRKPIKTSAKAETTTTASAGASYPYFISTLNEYNVMRSTLYLPNGFARKNGLHGGEMILRNSNRGSWLVEVRDVGRYVYIGRGWRDFQVANNLKKGDRFKFELVENGKKLIANFYRMGKLEKNEQEVENSSGQM